MLQFFRQTPVVASHRQLLFGSELQAPWLSYKRSHRLTHFDWFVDHQHAVTWVQLYVSLYWSQRLRQRLLSTSHSHWRRTSALQDALVLYLYGQRFQQAPPKVLLAFGMNSHIGAAMQSLLYKTVAQSR